MGVNAAAVSVLLAALYTPLGVSAIETRADFGLAITAFLLLAIWRVPPWGFVIAALTPTGLATPRYR